MNDASYEAGYRAGHLQGWLDAMAKLERDGGEGLAQPRHSLKDTASDEHERGPWQPAKPTAAVPTTSTAAVPAESRPLHVPQRSGPIRPPVMPAVERPVPPRLSPVQVRAQREKRDRQNINIILYVASLLLVAAAALFIGTSLPRSLRFAGVCAVTAVFYASGILLHARAPKLRPAAVAFTGTGLALVPIVGLALYNFALPNAPVTWLLTSILGVVAYVAAAVRLNSRVLVYLSLTFVISSTVSGVSVLGGALVWHFTSLVGVAVALTMVSLRRPSWVPPLYLRPLQTLHPYLVPAVAVAATVAPGLGLLEHALVMALATAYFTVMAVTTFMGRALHFYGARTALALGAFSFGWYLGDRVSDGFLMAAMVLAGQSVFLAFRHESLQRWMPKGLRPAQQPKIASTRWRLDVMVTFGLQLLLTGAFGISSWLGGLFLPADQVSVVPLALPVVVALLTGMLIAVLLGGSTEGAPTAAVAVSLLLSGHLDRWLVAGLLISLAIYWGARAAHDRGAARSRLILAARAAVTAAAPFVVLAVEGPHSGQVPHALTAFVLALACQHLATAALVRSRIPTAALNGSSAWFTGAGLLALVFLGSMDQSDGQILTAVSGLALLATALVSASVVTDHARLPAPNGVEPPASTWQLPEVLPLVAGGLITPLMFHDVGRGAGNTALSLMLAYFLWRGWRVRVSEIRAVYWLLSRAAGSLLAVSLFLASEAAHGTWVVGGASVGTASILVLVLALQLVLTLVPELRGRAPSWVVVDGGVVLAIQLMAASWAVLTQPGQMQLLIVVAFAAASAAAAGYVLRRRPAAAAFAPSVFLVLIVMVRGDLRAVELVLALFAFYSGVMVVAADGRRVKGTYFVAARVLTAALAVLLSYDVAASATVVTLTLAAVLAAQHVIRWLMRHRLDDIPFQQAAVWITLAGQALLPLGYLLQPFGSSNLDAEGGRWVLFVVLGLLMVSAAVAGKAFGARGASYFLPYAVLFGVLMLGPIELPGLRDVFGAAVLDSAGVAGVLMALALAVTATGIARRRRHVTGPDRWLWAASATTFSTAAIPVAWSMAEPVDDRLLGAALLVLAVVLFAAGQVKSISWAFPPAAGLVLLGAYVLAAGVASHSAIDLSYPWDTHFPWTAGVVPAASMLYVLRSLMRHGLTYQVTARWSLALAAIAGFASASLVLLQDDRSAWAGAVLMVVTAAVVAVETPDPQRRPVLELGALAVTASVQRAALLPLTGPGPWPSDFWLLQWYVVLAAVLGALRFISGQAPAGKLILGAGAGLLTLSGVLVILDGTGAQQLWVLLAMASLMLGGILLGERAFVWWGAGGVTLCVLWAMREYTFALLALIAVALIAFAVWRLNRSKSGN